MNAFDLLKQQHREADELFIRLESAPLERRGELLNQLADALAVHTMIEEKHFYPASMVGSETEDLLRAALDEHLGVKQLLTDLLEIDVTDPAFEARLETLRLQVEKHVREEEIELFPRVDQLLDPSRIEALGESMGMMARRLRGMAPRREIPRQVLAAARAEAEEDGRHAA
ncbi:Regulator of cell morphogenesis and NO signaling [Minicystis rosea]|nr:Regulator of cell morphogenesis and NO signaling [Minicystis rosea]